LSCDDAGASEDEGEDADGDEATAGGVPKPRVQARGLANVHKKGKEKLEDSAWITSQQEALMSASKDADKDASNANILEDWVISSDFDTALRMIHEKAKSKDAGSDLSRKGALNELFCASRIWGGGWGGQCTRTRIQGDSYCTMHRAEIDRQGYLTHGRIDGAIPPKKRKEFDMWQTKLRGRKENVSKSACDVAAGQTLTDSKDFSESGWRAMGRGAGESDRAYEFRTGIRGQTERKMLKRPACSAAATDGPIASGDTKETQRDQCAPSVKKRPAAKVLLDYFPSSTRVRRPIAKRLPDYFSSTGSVRRS